jgi:uncharacterized membrane protein
MSRKRYQAEQIISKLGDAAVPSRLLLGRKRPKADVPMAMNGGNESSMWTKLRGLVSVTLSKHFGQEWGMKVGMINYILVFSFSLVGYFNCPHAP